jgi:protein-disulfide isomerase
LFVTNHNNHNTPTGASGTPTSHIEGTSPEGVKLVEYGDYECPVCATFYQTVKQVAVQYNTKVQFQFRNLPLTSIHPNAFAGARAAEAAGLQGKFWEMHDLLYTNQSAWANASNPKPAFDSYAQQLGLNVTKFDTDYASDTVNRAINADLNAFSQTGDEMATPTFYLDGTKLDNLKLVDSSGTPTVDAFAKVLDAELAKKAPSTTKQ